MPTLWFLSGMSHRLKGSSPPLATQLLLLQIPGSELSNGSLAGTEDEQGDDGGQVPDVVGRDDAGEAVGPGGQLLLVLARQGGAMVAHRLLLLLQLVVYTTLLTTFCTAKHLIGSGIPPGITSLILGLVTALELDVAALPYPGQQAGGEELDGEEISGEGTLQKPPRTCMIDSAAPSGGAFDACIVMSTYSGIFLQGRSS